MTVMVAQQLSELKLHRPIAILDFTRQQRLGSVWASWWVPLLTQSVRGSSLASVLCRHREFLDLRTAEALLRQDGSFRRTLCCLLLQTHMHRWGPSLLMWFSSWIERLNVKYAM